MPDSGRHVTRRIVGVLIVAIWIGMIGWQIRREYYQPELTRLAEATLSLAPGVSFYTLQMGERSVGQATSRLDTVPDGFVLEDVMSLELPALGQTGTAMVRSAVQMTRSLEMKTFDFVLESSVGRFEANGVMRADSTLVVTIDSGSGPQTVEYKLATPPIFASILPIRLAMTGGLVTGGTGRFAVFDPSTLGTRIVELEVLEHDTLIVPDSASLERSTGRWSPAHYDSIPAWRVAESYGGVSVESWVDGDGRVIRASSPLGFSMLKTEYELALQDRDDQRAAFARGEPARGANEDVIFSTAIQSNVDLGAATRFEQIRFRRSGVDLSGFQLDGGRQSLDGDVLTVRRENWDELNPGYELPYKLMDLRDELQSEPLIQSDDPRILRQARQITAARAQFQLDPRRTAAQLNNAVFNMIAKEVTISIPSALQVLESRRGDCNEHTVLYVALARSLRPTLPRASRS